MTTFNKLLLIVFLTSILGSAQAQTTVPQIISSSQTWTAAGSPYIVSQNILVKGGNKVTVMPGTKIRATGNFRIIMESGAGFEARGTKDSVINIDTVNFEYAKGSIGHDFTTGTGAIFSYCYFKGAGLGGLQTINLSETPLLVSNCRFWNTYYTIYGINANTVPVKVRIEKSKFDWTKFNPGYVIYPLGNLTEFEMDDCEVKSSYGLMLAGTSTISRCLFYDWVSNTGFRIGHTNTKTTFKCNTFRKFKTSVIELYGPYTNREVVIVSNTFDSAENHVIYSVSGIAPPAKFVCKNNNFLSFSKSSIRIGGGSTPGYADTLVFTKNYWGTTSASQIANAIWDISDDITIGGLADFANFQTSLNNTCIEDETIENFVGITASVNKLSSIKFTTYPNPAANFVTIQSSQELLKSWKIFSSTGMLMSTGEFKSNENRIDLSNFNNGFYLIEVSTGKHLSSKQKLIVNH
jgi:hypothetical protein